MTTEIPTTQIIAPRIARNKTLLDKFLADNKIESQWPSVESQLSSVVISGLREGGYNGSIIRYQGNLLLAYRFHPDHTASTRIAIAELNSDFQVISDQELDLHDESISHEDARLCEFNGKLLMSYVSSHWPAYPAASVKYVVLNKVDRWRATVPVEYPYPDRDTIDKNHVTFQHGDKLQIIYRRNPKQIIYQAGGSETYTSDALRWPYGEIRGGTTPIPYEGKLLSFFHSSLRNEMPATVWRYYLGALLMEPEPPFKMIAVSKRPITRGSEVGGDTSRNHFKKNVIFPMGALKTDYGFAVSAGVNDSQVIILNIKESELNL